MWSHTIQSSKSTKAPAARDKPAKVNGLAATGSNVQATKEVGIPPVLEADGFSKISRVNAAKKPVTVAKAPTLGRTASRREEEPVTPTESRQPSLEKRASKVTIPPVTKGMTPVRTPRTGTPTRPPLAAAKTKPLLSRTKPPAQASGTPKASTALQGRPPVRSPKATVTAKGGPNTDKLPSKSRTPDHLGDGVREEIREEGLPDNGPSKAIVAEEDAVSADLSADAILKSSMPQDGEEAETLSSKLGLEAIHPISDQYQGEHNDHPDIRAHEELNRKIALRNDTIKSLRRELQKLRTTQELPAQNTDSKIAAQIRSLRSELDSVRSTLVDLDGTHRSTLEKHDSLLRSRDKIIQNLSSEAQELRLKLEASDQAKTQVIPDVHAKLQTVDPVQASGIHDEVSESKEEEIQSLSEIVQDLRKQLEAADTARAKEIYDELLRSKDEKLESASDVVQNLKGELKATKPLGKQKHDSQLLRSKDEEIRSLSHTVQDLKDRLEAVDQAKEQEVNHSVTSLRDEFQDLKNKDKRKIEDLEAAASRRAEALQSHYDELLRSRDQEIKDMVGMTQDLQEEIGTARRDQKQELDNITMRYEQRLQNLRIEHDEELSVVNEKYAQELANVRADHQDIDATRQSSLDELTRKHKVELESLRVNQQSADTSHQQELRETRRKHEQALESIKLEAQNGVREEMARLTRELEDTSTKHQKEIDDVKQEHRENIAENAKNFEQTLRDATTKHARELEEASVHHEQQLKAAERESDIAFEKEAQQHRSELEEANEKYQQDLADIERLRGQGSHDVSQEYENQLRTIADNYQQELGEAATRLNNTASCHKQELQEAKENCDHIQTQSEKYHRELEETRGKYELFENENRIQGQRLQEWAVKHDKEIETVSTKYQETMDQANARLSQLMEATAIRKQEDQHRIAEKGRELMQVRIELDTAAAEVASFKAIIEDMKLSRSDADADSKRIHQQELDEMTLRREQELNRLRTDFEAAAAEIASLQNVLIESEALKSTALGNAARVHEQLLRDATSEHEEVVSRLRGEYETVTEEARTLKLRVRESDHAREQGAGEVAFLQDQLKKMHLAKEEAKMECGLLKDNLELSRRENRHYEDANEALRRDTDRLEAQIVHSAKEVDRERREAAVGIELLNDKKGLADQENRQNAKVITVLREDIERLQAQLDDASADLKRERKEAVVELALLKDKLELAELQKRSASEDMSLSRNEANVEIALLKDKLELADLQSRQDKKTITALQDELQAHNTGVPDMGPYVHHQLREELALLARRHATNLADVAALKASILAERDVREEQWKKKAESRERLTKEMQGLGAELNGIAEAH